MEEQQQQQQQQQINSGLTRYRSAPSSYFADLISSNNLYGGAGEVSDQFINPRASSPDSDKLFSRFMSSCGAQESNENSFVNEAVQAQFMVPMKHERDVIHPQRQQNQMVYQTQTQSGHKPVGLKPGMDTSFNVGSSMGMDNLTQMKMAGGSNNSNLIRQSSSPAGLFAQVNVDTADYAVMRGMGKSGTRTGNHGEASYLSGSRLNNQMEFPPGPPSSSGMISHVFKVEAKSFGADALESGSYGESGGTNDGSYSFRNTSWDDSAFLPDNFLAGLAENDRNAFSNINSSQNQIGEGGNRPSTVLAHHLSLPTSSSELSAMEKLLQFPDFVPLRSRAKRGCATHPRSIAERVRRTKISERMRKLQELVPNMDKQTNTSDMLDLAVDYIKDLQKEVKTLSDVRAKCTCSNNKKT